LNIGEAQDRASLWFLDHTNIDASKLAAILAGTLS